jgi:hypothetical protein
MQGGERLIAYGTHSCFIPAIILVGGSAPDRAEPMPSKAFQCHELTTAFLTFMQNVQSVVVFVMHLRWEAFKIGEDVIKRVAISVVDVVVCGYRTVSFSPDDAVQCITISSPAFVIDAPRSVF